MGDWVLGQTRTIINVNMLLIHFIISTMEKPEDFTKQRESNITAYSELTSGIEKEELTRDVWGVAEYKGELISCYIDEGLARDVFTNRIIKNFSERGLIPGETVKIIDFGGGDGALIDIVSKQLTEAGYKVVGVNLEMNEDRFPVMKEKFMPANEIETDRKIYGVQGTIIEKPTIKNPGIFDKMPIQVGSLDAGYSRFVLQYIPKERQPEAIREMLAALKPGGELVIMWPIAAETEDQASVMDDLDVNMDSIVLGKNPDEIRGKRHLTSLEEMRKIAEDLGVSCDVELVEDYMMFYSAESFARKFKVTDEIQLQKLKDFFSNQSFKKMAQSAGYEMKEDDGKTYWGFKVAVAVLKK
jgi:SAM-dependent methyltransferase